VALNQLMFDFLMQCLMARIAQGYEVAHAVVAPFSISLFETP
jgi:hypothetical protein